LTTFIGELERCPNLSCRTLKPQDSWGTLLEPGDTLDRHYRILKRLAIGGAGVTYLGREIDAVDDEVGPLVAIKVLYAQRDQGSFLRRLSNEAQILQELDHPNIVQLMGFVHRKGHSPYLLTCFEAGGSLLDHLRRVGALSLKVAAAIGIQLTAALAVAHARDVIHRDLKPENVLLAAVAEEGEVPQTRITDFGIAKVFGGLGGNLTRVGSFVGTPQYAAPEQFEGREPSPATDIYALGAVLHFLVTLKPVVPVADQLSPDQTLEVLRQQLPPRLSIAGAHPGEMAAFNAVLAATMAEHPLDREGLERVRELLDAVIYDRPALVGDGHTPPLHDPSPLPPGMAARTADDTFQGILSRTDPDARLDTAEVLSETGLAAGVSGGRTNLPPQPIQRIPADPPVGPPADPPPTPPVDPPPADPLDEAPTDLPVIARPPVDPPVEPPVTPPVTNGGSGGGLRKVVLGLGGLVLLGVLGLGGVFALAVAGLVDLSGVLPEELVPGGGGGEATETPSLTLDRRDPQHQKDYLAIQESLDRQKGKLTGCDLGSSVSLKLGVQSDGSASSVRATGLESKAERCLEKGVAEMNFDRRGKTASRAVWFKGTLKL